MAVSSKTTGPSFCLENERHQCRGIVLSLGLILAAYPAIAANDLVTTFETHEAEAASGSRMAFNLPSQPLASALEAYGEISGWQVVYEGRLAIGRRSAAVTGSFMPEEALRKLLMGTGLAPRYMASDGFVLVPKPIEHRSFTFTTTPQSILTQYYGSVQAGLRRSVCADERVRSIGYRIAVGIWISVDGGVSRSVLLDTTGNSGMDAAIERDVNNARIDEAPPIGLAQPVVIVITSDVMRECDKERDRGVRQIKVEQ